jgi:hypothetical protein
MKNKILLLLLLYSSVVLANMQMDTVNMYDMPLDSLMLKDSISTEDTLYVDLLVDIMENAVVYQDSLVRDLMVNKRLGIQRGVQERDGFRVQVFSSNQQQSAKNQALKLQVELSALLEEPAYAISEPPFWKVRIGNFLTREEANMYRMALIAQFPELQGSTYVVPDKIVVVNQ